MIELIVFDHESPKNRTGAIIADTVAEIEELADFYAVVNEPFYYPQQGRHQAQESGKYKSKYTVGLYDSELKTAQLFMKIMENKC